MEWYEPLYVGKKAFRKRRKLISCIKHGKYMPEAHVIALSLDERELLDIYPLYVLMQKGFPKDRLYIVGIAADKGEAVRLVERIISDTYKATGGVGVREFLLGEHT